MAVMRNPISNTARWIVRAILSLCVITGILVVHGLLHEEYAKYEKLAQQQIALQDVKYQLVRAKDTLAKNVVLRIPPVKASAKVVADGISALDRDISAKRAVRDKLWNDHPIERLLPFTDTFLKITQLDIELGYLQQVLAHVKNLHSFVAGPAEVERQMAWHAARSRELADRIFQNKTSQWKLSQSDPLSWQIPLTPASKEMQRLETEEKSLQSTRGEHDAEIQRLGGRLAALIKRPLPSQIVLDHRSAERILQQVDEHLAQNAQLLSGSNFQKFMRPVQEKLPMALGILALALASPLLVKGVAYYLIAPLAARCRPVHLLPGASGKISTATGSAGGGAEQAGASRVSLPLLVDERTELLILPSYLQGLPLHVDSSTRWLLDWSIPFTSLLAGMYRLICIRPSRAEHITISSSTDPLVEFSLLDVPAGTALVLQPSCLIGVIQNRHEGLKISRHWRIGSLHAWMTLQFRYIVFHGPAKLLVKGCRGVRVEPVIVGRGVNQAATLGFSANLAYAVARNETFWPYFFGERELFNDSWNGEGVCVHAETPSAGDRSGLFGRGIYGMVDTVLKTFGI
ncbi:hypothetical protein [Zoogloea sp.]|uniref:hypothetical protein n=1 Tax=Zoogloea sp. TaxID=49181 RepID=UPI0032201F15